MFDLVLSDGEKREPYLEYGRRMYLAQVDHTPMPCLYFRDVSDPESAKVKGLIESMTAYQSEERLTMITVAEELKKVTVCFSIKLTIKSLF